MSWTAIFRVTCLGGLCNFLASISPKVLRQAYDFLDTALPQPLRFDDLLEVDDAVEVAVVKECSLSHGEKPNAENSMQGTSSSLNDTGRLCSNRTVIVIDNQNTGLVFSCLVLRLRFDFASGVS